MLLVNSCEFPEKEIDSAKEPRVPAPIEERVTIIDVYDNYQINPELTTGWGFGCVVRTPTEDILFDTGGNGSILLSNMEKMNISPEDIDIVVISHIHGDHTGGLRSILERNPKLKVYIPASFPDSWRIEIESYGAEFQDVKTPTKITDNALTTGEMGILIKEQSLILNTKQGLIIITGCAHPGVLNIAKKAKQILPNRDIYLIMGGFHLSGASDSALRSIVAGFRQLGIQRVAPSHCSGDRCRELFQEEYRADYIDSGVGAIITLRN